MVARFNSSDEVLEFRVKDPSGRTLDIRRSNKEDSEEGGRILNWLIEKWGWRPRVRKTIVDTETEFLKF